MEKEDYFYKLKEIQSKILDFLENDDDVEENFQILNELFNNIEEDGDELGQVLYLISKISQNHYRQLNFFNKIEKILLQLKEKIKNNFSDENIYNIFKKDIRIVWFLIESKIIAVDQIDINESINLRYRIKHDNFVFYCFKEIKSFIEDNLSNTISKKISKFLLDESFDKKRKIGENDNEICELIRNDKIGEFITYVNKNIVPLQSQIPESIFETNRYLIRHKPSLIEYSAFFGSIQIFTYLFKNKVTIPTSIWVYAIHGNNPELISFLQENKILPLDPSYNLYYKEAIKCHHNEMAEYIKNNFLNKKCIDIDLKYNYENNIVMHSLKYYNYENIPIDFCNNNFVFHYLCQYDYFSCFKFLLENKKIDINATVILNIMNLSSFK